MEPERTTDSGARDLFIWASGFGLGAMVVLLFGIFLIGIGGVSHGPTAQPTASPPAQSRAAAPAQTAPPARPETSGQAATPAPAPAPAPNQR